MKNKTALLAIACLGTSLLLGCSHSKSAPDQITSDNSSTAGSPPANSSSQGEPDYTKRSPDENVKEAGAYMQKKDYDKAERALLAALHQVDGYPGQEGRQAEILNNLAAVYEEKEMYAQCIPLLNKAQKLFIRAYGRKFQGVYITLGNMGRVLGKQARWEEAAQVYQTAIDLMEEAGQSKSEAYKSMVENGVTAWERANNAHKADKLKDKLKKLK